MAPCKDCQDRYLGCHSNCDRYRKFLQENERIKELRRDCHGYLEPRTMTSKGRKDLFYSTSKGKIR